MRGIFLILGFLGAGSVWVACGGDSRSCGAGSCLEPDGGEVPLDLSDTGDLSMISSTPDMSALGKFGDPCTNAKQCESQLCVLAGLSGVCTQYCPPDCPSTYGCFSVLGGGIDPGLVVQICVPENKQLCSPCAMSSECSSAAQDLCLPSALGGNFCGSDCTSVSCAPGYTCETLNLSGITVKQCRPTAPGSCDCRAVTQAGTTKACSVPTPFGTCNAVRTCGGASGWGACQGAATDLPDEQYQDDNCDGIDGELGAGVFVATTGIDRASGATAGCGLVYTDPCRTVDFGLERAVEESKKYVYVQAGNYNEVTTLQAGKTVVGGYDTNWQRAARTVGGHETHIKGTLDAGSGQYLAVKAQGLSVKATLMDLYVDAPSADAFAYGKGSYGVYADNAKLDLVRVTVTGATGADGAAGSPGSNAASGVTALGAMDGTSGGNASQGISVCNSSARGGPGGSGGNGNCASQTAGGDGGSGGTKDTCCDFNPFNFCVDYAATSGTNGTVATHNTVGGYGYFGSGSGTCAAPGAGHAGSVDNGAGGVKSGTGGSLSGGYWLGSGGASGGIGSEGGGGGGGGGSGGCDTGTDSYGAGGGGGGAGGCKAQSGGGGGGGGGGSFGVFAINGSAITATSCVVQRGNGGGGGPGGTGGQGQSGGSGGPGGVSAGGSKTGGPGGGGGHGGHGGGGAGGAGGMTAAFFNLGSTVIQSCTISGGAGGVGGDGGASAPGAPLVERDGNAGDKGSSGAVVPDVFVCGSSGGC